MRKRLRAYGLSVPSYLAMIEAQCGSCAICAVPLEVGSASTHVDHCHATGRVRGVLCVRCNMGLGYFKDRTDVMAKAISYLELANAA